MNSNQCSHRDSNVAQRVPIETSTGDQSISSQSLSKSGARPRINNEQRIRRVEKLATWMDSAFRIPGTSLRIGLDSLIGLLPGVGDLSTFAVGCYIIREAWILRMPKRHLLRMAWNTTFDMALGSVPLLGDVFDFAFKSNLKNASIILDHFDQQGTIEPSDH